MVQPIDSPIHHLIIESLHEHIAVMDQTSRIVFVNRAWKKFADQNDLGLENYGVGYNYIDLCEKATGTDSEKAGEIAGQLSNLLSGAIESFSAEYPCHAPDRQRWFRLNVSYFMMNDTRWAVMIHENITTIKQTAMDLIKSENKLKGILASVPDAMLMYDISLNIVWSNDPAKAIFGPDLDHQKCVTAFGKPDKPCDNCIVLKTFASGQVHSGEYTHPDMNGNQRTFLCRSSIAGYDIKGDPSLVMEILHDITRRKADEKEIRQLSQAVEYSPVSVVITDVNGTIEYVNPKFTEVTGYTLEEARGQNPRILSSKKQSENFYKNLWETIKIGNAWQGEFNNIKKNGDPYWESASISPIFNDKKEIIHFVAVKEDITEQKKMICQLEEAKVLAESATQAKGNFLATMSHEIRTPMNAILGMSRLVMETDLDDTQKRYVSNVHTAADALMAVIDDILDFSRAEAGQLKILQKEFELTKVIEKTIRVMTFTAEENNITLSYQFRHSSPLFLSGDPVHFNQIIINLISNALKYTPAGKVTVSSEIMKEEPGRMFIKTRVQDTGIGMTEDQLASLFQPFTQADGSSSRKQGGTGLGLAIVKHLVTLMDGIIDVTSIPGEGSVFSVTLPFLKIASTQDSLLPPVNIEKNFLTAAALSHLKEKKILVVDDDETNREIIRAFLEKIKVDVHEAPDGKKAVDILSAYPFHLVFMDIEMPGMDGYETTGKIRNLTVPWAKDVPIIALTGHTWDEFRKKGLVADMNDHLEKPVNRDNLFRLALKWIHPDDSEPVAFLKKNSDDYIDLESGLAYVDNNQALYVKMLKKFSDSYSGKEQDLLAAYKNADAQSMRFLLHNLRSISGMIGAAGLEQAALELTGRLNDEDQPFDKNPDFSKKVDSISRLLQQVITAARKLPDTLFPEKTFPVKHLKTLQEMIRRHQPVECRNLLGRIKALDISPDVSDHLKSIEKLIDAYRFRDAEKKLLSIIKGAS